MYFNLNSRNEKFGQEYANDNGHPVLSGTFLQHTPVFKRDKKKERGDVVFWSFAMVGACVYVAAIIDNYGNWKAMTLFLLAGLFGLLGLASMVLKIIKKVKEIQLMNMDLKARVQWIEHVNEM